MVVGFILPKRSANSIKDRIGFVCAGAFQSIGDPADWTFRSDQQVDVIWHYDKSVQGEVIQFHRSFKDATENHPGNSRVSKPARAIVGFVENCVDAFAFSARRGSGSTAIPGCAVLGRQGIVESPGKKDGRAFRLPVREIAAVEGGVGD